MVRLITAALSEYYARLQFWWASKTIKEHVHFEYDNSVEDSTGIVLKIKKRPFAGVVVEVCEFTMRDENGGSMLDFTTRVVYNKNNADVTSKKFNVLVAKIVRLILAKSIEKVEVKDLDEDRNTDIVESDEERAVPEEVAAVSEKRVSKRKPRKKTVSGNTEILPEVQQSTKPKRTKTSTRRKKRSDGA